ncbi:alpha-ketoglutarate-dependent dioxygenase AlkB [Ferruginibacter sp.]
MKSSIRKKEIILAGNLNLNIYGLLSCKSGKRMKKENRIFFLSEKIAIENGYRPCGRCMKEKYKTGKMHLFPNSADPNINLLPNDGTVNYYGTILDSSKAKFYYDTLLKTIEWKNDEAIIFNKHIITKRKAAWYGDSNYAYTYSNATKYALPWTAALLELKNKAEELSQATYNSCLLNLYHNGDEGMAWHSDDEKTLAKNGAIASLSFGAERKFSFKHKQTKETVAVLLESGSLLVMKGTTQTNWLHRLPPTKKIHQPRVNLTFRTIFTG